MLRFKNLTPNTGQAPLTTGRVVEDTRERREDRVGNDDTDKESSMDRGREVLMAGIVLISVNGQEGNYERESKTNSIGGVYSVVGQGSPTYEFKTRFERIGIFRILFTVEFEILPTRAPQLEVVSTKPECKRILRRVVHRTRFQMCT